MKKNTLLILCFFLLGTFAKAQNGLENIIVEKYYISNAADATGSIGSLPSGSTTYRVYVDMLPGYKFQAAYGVAGHLLTINSTANFFNNEDYGATTPAFSKTNAAKNSVMLDSWFSVGAACTSNFGILKSEDDGVNNVVNNTSPQILQGANAGAGIPLTIQDGLIAGSPEAVTFVGIGSPDIDVFDGTSLVGNSFSTSNGSWASLNGSTGPTSANKVLIGQFTTHGCFSFELNVQIGTPTGGVQNFVARDPVGSEILFPGLVYNKAAVVISASPAGAVCSGTSVTFTATPINGGTTPVFQWKKNNVVVGTNSPTYTVSTLANGNTIKCLLTSNATLCNTAAVISNVIIANISPLPSATVTVTGPTTFCSGQNLSTLTAPSGAGFTYQWRKGSTNIVGATNVSYVPTTTNLKYNVMVTNSNGCVKTSANTSITVNALPAATITPQGPTTFCAGDSVVLQANGGGGLTYQWKKGSANISGATKQNYTAKTGGSYKIIVTNANGCSKTSVATVVTINCRNANLSLTAGSGNQLSISPNPTNGLFALKISNGSIEDGSASIEITNAAGQNIFKGKAEFSNGELIREIRPSHNWAKGLYFVKVSVKDAVYNGKIVLQ